MDAAAREGGQSHPLCVAVLPYSPLWCLKASRGRLLCPRRGALGQAGDLHWHHTAGSLINVLLLLLFQGAKGLSASETNGK